MTRSEIVSGLDGKSALITGGSRGIGKAIALGFARHGCNVAIVARNQEELRHAADEITAAGTRSIPISADMADASEIRRAFETAVEGFGRIDILVNNASTPPPLRPLLECDEESWERAMNVNVKAYFLLSQLALRDMIPRRWGRVINLSSSTALKARAGMGEYAVSKAAELMLTRLFAVEVGQYDITVNAIAPVLTKTRHSARQWRDPDQLERVLSKQAIKRLAEPEDVVGAALLLASDAGRMITGHTVTVDGGLLA